jgi:hypothetical protein
MAQLSNKMVSRLRRIADELTAFLADIDAGKVTAGGETDIPPEIAEKVARRECLMCGRILPESYKRGLCHTHYTYTKRKLDTDEWSESERVAAGKLLWVRPPGRKPMIETAQPVMVEPETDGPTEGKRMRARADAAAERKNAKKSQK